MNAVVSDLPIGWKCVPLKDVVHIILGQSPSSSTYNKEGRGLPFFQGKTEFGEIYPSVRQWCTEPKKIAEKEDVLVSVRAPVGPTNMAPSECAIGRGLAALRPLGGSDSKYFLYLIRRYQDKLAALGTGTTFEAISGDKLKNFVVPIAPIEQQKRIVAKIEELFSHIDAGIASLQAAKKLLKQYRQSVLKAAVTGELTKDWREQNNHSRESWKCSTIGAVANVETGKTPKRSSEEFWEKGTIPWLTSSATSKEFTDHADQFVTQTAVDEGLKLFEPGTLLLAMYGEGKTRGQVTEITFQATCNQACAAITVDEDKVIREFTRIRLYENYEQTRKAASGGNQPNLNLSKVRDISLPLPSLEEQGEIVARVGQKFIFIKRLETDLEVQLLKAVKNKQSILASAFSGNLKWI